MLKKSKLKRALVSTLVVAGGFVAFGELDDVALGLLDDIEILGVNNDTFRDKDRNKSIVLEVETSQYADGEESIPEGFRMRFVVELTDKKTKKQYLVDYTVDRPGDMEYEFEYTGQDHWFLYMPYGEMSGPKITGYVVQYGFMDGDNFLIRGEEFDDVKTLDELVARNKTPYPDNPKLYKLRVKYYYMYNDEEEGEMELDPPVWITRRVKWPIATEDVENDKDGDKGDTDKDEEDKDDEEDE
jgi:hypothetical protein